LWSPDVTARKSALDALAATGDFRVVAILGEFLRDREPVLRRAAIDGLGKIPGPESEDLLWNVLYWKGSLPEERKAVLFALAGHGTDRAADLLFDLGRELPDGYRELAMTLAEDRFPARVAWRRALESGDKAALAENPGDGELAELLVRLSESRVPAGRVEAIAALARLGDERAIRPLVAESESESGRVRSASIAALGQFRTPESTYALARMIGPGSKHSLAEQGEALKALVAHDNELAAALALELSFLAGDEIRASGMQGDVEALLHRRLAERMAARASQESNAAAEVELLLDLRVRGLTGRVRSAIGRAGELQANVVPALEPLLSDPSVAPDVVEALGRYSGKRGLKALAVLSVRPTAGREIRERAIGLVGARADVDVSPLLLEMYARMDDEELKLAVARLLNQRYPDLAHEKGLDRVELDRRGLIPMMLVGAAHGAVNIWLLSEVSAPGDDKIMALPALGGAILGAGTPLLLTLGDEVKPVESVWVGTMGLWGMTEGALLAAALNREGGDDIRWGQGLVLAGQTAGVVAGWLSRKSAGRDPGQIGYVNLSGAVGGYAGAGAAILAEDPDDRVAAGLALGGSAAGLLLSGILAPDLRFTRADVVQSFSTVWMTGWTGGCLALAAMPEWEGEGSDERARKWAGGGLLGAATGFVAASVLSAYTEADPGMMGYLNLSFAAGNALGLGISLQQDGGSPRANAAWMAGGGGAGLALAGLAARDFRFSRKDVFETSVSTGLGLWSGYLAADALHGDGNDEQAAFGGALIGGAAGFAAGSIVAANAEPNPSTLGRSLLGFGTGTLLGAGLGLSIPDLETYWIEAMMLGGGWAGLGTMAAIENHTSYSGGDMALIGFGAAWGTWQGLSIRQASGGTTDRSLNGALLLGVSAGATVAMAAGQFLDADPSAVGRAATGAVEGTIIGHGLGMLIPELEDGGIWTLAMAGGWAGLVTKGFFVPPADFTGGDYAAVIAGAAWGLGQGALIGHSAGLDGDRLQGAMLLGMGTGLLAGEAFGRAGDLRFSSVFFTELSAYSGSGLGAGTALLLEEDSETVTAATSIAGWGAKILTGFVADRLKFRGNDTWEYLLGQGFGLWQGLGYASVADCTEAQMGGAALLGMSMGYFLPLAWNQFLDYSFAEDLVIAGGTVWGTWLGGFWSYGLGADDEDVLLASLVGGDIGLVVSGLLLSPAVDIDTARMGWVQLAGLMGMALGVSGTGIFSEDGRTVVLGMQVGSTAGLIAGALVTQWWRPWSGAGGGVADSTEPLVADQTSGPRLRLGGIDIPVPMPATFVAPPPAGSTKPAMLVGVQGVL
jgi:HEAT repeat protein